MSTITVGDVSKTIGMKGSLFTVPEDFDFSFVEDAEYITILPTDSSSVILTYTDPTVQIVKTEDGISYFRIMPSNKKEMEKEAEEERQNRIVQAAVAVARINAQNLTDEQALLVQDIYDVWSPDTEYTQNEFFTYNGELYKVNQTHTSQSNWIPGTAGTESLYTKVTLNESGYPIWQQPTGAHDAYNKGDIVEYNGELYISLIDGNTYSPDSYPDGWEKYIEE